MEFVIGQRVIANKKYIKKRGELKYGGFYDMKQHIKNGNKPVKIVDIDLYLDNSPVYVVEGIHLCSKFGLDGKEILPVSNSIQKMG